MSKIAAEAAREIFWGSDWKQRTGGNDYPPDLDEITSMAAIIERALSQSLAERDAQMLELANIWRLRSSPATHADGAELLCADELEALLKGKAI